MPVDFITEEIKTALNLTDDQVAGIEKPFETYIGTEKGKWDLKANEDAEKIIAGAIETTAKKFNIELPRDQGEKNADYLARLNEKVVSTQQAAVTALETEYKQKLKDFNGGDATKEELEKAKKDLDAAQVKLANYDELTEKAGKVEGLLTENLTLKQSFAFNGVKPSIPEGVNPYEFSAKWSDLEKAILEKNTIEIIENVAWAIDKENIHIKHKLSDLVAADKPLSDLLAGREQKGPNARVIGKTSVVEGITLPENPTSEDVSKAINEHLDKLNVPKVSKERTKKFMELNSKIAEALKK